MRLRNTLTAAKAFKDIARGERTAAALESQLSSIEKRIDDLLARADQDQQSLERQAEQVEASKSESSKSDSDSKQQEDVNGEKGQ